MTAERSRKATAKKKSAASAEKAPAFDEGLERLEEIVEALEEGSLPLEKALTQFEQGIRLSKQLEKQLRDAEVRVQKLVEAEGDPDALEALEESTTPPEKDPDDDGNPTLPF